jgi:hypothetical protein
MKGKHVDMPSLDARERLRRRSAAAMTVAPDDDRSQAPPSKNETRTPAGSASPSRSPSSRRTRSRGPGWPPSSARGAGGRRARPERARSPAGRTRRSARVAGSSSSSSARKWRAPSRSKKVRKTLRASAAVSGRARLSCKRRERSLDDAGPIKLSRASLGFIRSRLSGAPRAQPTRGRLSSLAISTSGRGRGPVHGPRRHSRGGRASVRRAAGRSRGARYRRSRRPAEG